MSAVFEIMAKSDGEFQFQYLNGSGQKLMTSVSFSDKVEAEQSIKDVRVGSMMSEKIAVASTPEGEKFFVIKDQAGKIVVKSILFDNELNFNNALHSVRDNACIAEVVFS